MHPKRKVMNRVEVFTTTSNSISGFHKPFDGLEVRSLPPIGKCYMAVSGGIVHDSNPWNITTYIQE